MTTIEFLDAHFVGLSVTAIAVVAIYWIGAFARAAVTAEAMRNTFRH